MKELADHEKHELHEYLAFKNVCTTKSMAMSIESYKLMREPYSDYPV